MTQLLFKQFLLKEIPSPLLKIIQGELNDNEKIIWMAQPKPGRFVLQSLPTLLFGIPWTAFALFWTAGAAGFRIPDFSSGVSLFPLFGVPFIIIGIGLLSSPYFALRNAKKTAYVITESRAIIFEGGRNITIKSLTPDKLKDLARTQKPDGSGDIVFEKSVSRDRRGNRTETEVGFLGIENVKKVEEIIKKIAENN